MNGAGAHGAWLGAGVEGTFFQRFRWQGLGRQPHEIGFGMTGAIALCVHRILGFEQDLIGLIHQERAKGVIAVVTSALGNDKRPPQMH